MAGFPPARGAGNPFAAILGGLGAGLQGFMQGQEFKEDLADRKLNREATQQQLSENKFKDSATNLDVYRSLAQSDPTLANNPQFVSSVNQAGSGIGVNYGQQLPRTFSQIPFTDLMQKSPALLEYLQGLPPEQRGQILQNFSGVPDAVSTAPAMITNPLQQARFPGLVEQQMSLVTQGKLDPHALISWVRTFAPRYGFQPDEILQEYKPQIGELAQAKANQIIASTGLTADKAAMYQKLTQSQIDKNLAGASEQTARAEAIPQQTMAEITKANAAAQSAANGAAQVQIKLNAIAQLGGTDPTVFRAVNGAISDAAKRVNNLRVARDNLNNQWIRLASGLNGSDPKVQHQIAQLQAQAGSLTKQLNGAESTLSQFEQGHMQMLDKANHALGLPSSFRTTKNQVQFWHDQNSKTAIKVTSYDGGLTFTDGKGNWFDANKQSINGPTP